jgi:hypothetical protein
MKTKILMTVSFVATMAVTVPAMADTSVLCSVRGNYKNASVGADYKPGVDVKGKPVVSADIAPAPMAAPKSMTIPLTIDMAQRFNTVLPAGSKMEAQVGTVDIMQNGAVMINGKDVTSAADSVCSTMEKQKASALRTNDVPKAHKKKAAVAKKQSSSEVPPVEAAPAAEVKAEPVTPPATTPAPPTPTPSAPEASPAPQVLDATPPSMPPAAPAPAAPQPTPVTTPAAPAPAPAPAAPNAAPTPPASGAIVSPTEGNNVPRAPLDPLSGQPAPASPTPAPANGTLSGGAQ